MTTPTQTKLYEKHMIGACTVPHLLQGLAAPAKMGGEGHRTTWVKLVLPASKESMDVVGAFRLIVGTYVAPDISFTDGKEWLMEMQDDKSIYRLVWSGE